MLISTPLSLFASVFHRMKIYRVQILGVSSDSLLQALQLNHSTKAKARVWTKWNLLLVITENQNLCHSSL